MTATMTDTGDRNELRYRSCHISSGGEVHWKPHARSLAEAVQAELESMLAWPVGLHAVEVWSLSPAGRSHRLIRARSLAELEAFAP